MELTPEQYARALELIRAIRNAAGRIDYERGSLMEELGILLRNPHMAAIMLWSDVEFSDEEVIAKALEYKPFAV